MVYGVSIDRARIRVQEQVVNRLKEQFVDVTYYFVNGTSFTYETSRMVSVSEDSHEFDIDNETRIVMMRHVYKVVYKKRGGQ